jgi:hypothetical protein
MCSIQDTHLTQVFLGNSEPPDYSVRNFINRGADVGVGAA